MPSRKSLASESHSLRPMVPSPWSYPEAMAPPSEADACERAVQAIWHSLDEHDLVNEEGRRDLAAVLEPLAELGLERARRLVKTLRLPDPIDAAQLYWLTRRLLTFVPELQAAANASSHDPRPPGPSLSDG